MLADLLDMPYVHVDAASIPDPYTAASQFFGSARGIVNSNQPGRLEKAAKHHAGAVVEVADLDHAVPTVRCVLADQFLQILETGIGQSATGASFCCDKLIFVFTMNLPGQLDEKVRKRIGFGSELSRTEITDRVTTELRKVVSGAFLSRVGRPILFQPLTDASVAQIVEREIVHALRVAASRGELQPGGIQLEDGLGARLLATADANAETVGARGLQDTVRTRVSRAFIGALRSDRLASGHAWHVSMDAGGELVVSGGAAGPQNRLGDSEPKCKRTEAG